MPALTDLAGAARLLIAAILIAAIIFKIFDGEGFRRTLRDLAVPNKIIGHAAAAVVAIELLVATLLLVAPPMVAGSATAALFLAFAAVVISRRGATAGCGCMGARSAAGKSLWAKALPRLGGVLGGVLVATHGAASDWFGVDAMAPAAVAGTAYVGFIMARGSRERGAALAEVSAGPPVSIDGSRSAGLLPRRGFLAALAGAPAGLLLPNAVRATEMRHCGSGCPSGQRCHCCYETHPGVPTCACWPQEAPTVPPECRPICCGDACCLTIQGGCENECQDQQLQCYDTCLALGCVGSELGCLWCFTLCDLERQMCQGICAAQYLNCSFASQLCSSEDAPKAQPVGAGL